MVYHIYLISAISNATRHLLSYFVMKSSGQTNENLLLPSARWWRMQL